MTEKKCAPAAEIDPACEDESKGVVCREVEEEVCQQVETEQCRPIQRTVEEEECQEMTERVCDKIPEQVLLQLSIFSYLSGLNLSQNFISTKILLMIDRSK